MERFRVNAPDTLQLHPECVSSPNGGPVSSTLKVVSYSQGKVNTGNYSVSKFPDGTIVLDDGKNKVIQRPYNHPERRAARRASAFKKVQTMFSDFVRMLFPRSAT